MATHVELLTGLVNVAIPEVYQKGMSYYEVLTAVVNKVNELIKQSNEYFSEDVQTVMTKILIGWKNDGTLSALIADAVLKIGDQTYTEQNFVTNGESITHSINSLDLEMGDVSDISDMLRKKSLNIVNVVEQYGVDNTGVEDASTKITLAINELASIEGGIVYLPKGKYYVADPIIVKDNIQIIGDGETLTLIDLKENMGIEAFSTPTPTEKIFTQTNDIKIGDTSISIINDLQAGDFIVFQSSDRFTEEWDRGTAIRSYYNKGELFKIKSATPTTIEFTEPASFDLPVSSAIGVKAFTPTKNISIKNLSVTRNIDLVSRGSSYKMDYCDNAILANVGSYNANNAGIRVSKSRNVKIENYNCVGGTADLALNYGVMVGDGSKQIYMENIKTSNCRHGIAGGGSGYAVAIGVTANNIFIENSQAESLDAHGNTMNFIYTNCIIDNGISMSGRGHIADNIKSKKGVVNIYEGGVDITYNNISCEDCSRLYSNKSVHRVYINNTTLNFHNPGVTGVIGFNDSSTNIVFDNLRMVNHSYKNATTNNEADATFNSNSYIAVKLFNNSTLKNSYIEGFPVGCAILGSECIIDNVRFINCGWVTSFTPQGSVLKLVLRSEKSYINNVIITFNKNELSLLTRVLSLDPFGVGTGKGIVITNVREGSNHTKNYNYGIASTADFTELFMQNVRFTVSTNANNATGKFIYNTIVADN